MSSADPVMPTCLAAPCERDDRLIQPGARVLLAALAERRVAEALLDGGRLGGAGLGEREHALALGLFALDQPLVLEQLERGIHGPRARTPCPAAALLELLHDLVAVHGLAGERQEDRRADVAALGARPGTPAVTGTAEPGAEAGAEPGAVATTSVALTFAPALAAAFAGAAGAEPPLAAIAAGAAGAPAAPLTFTVRSARRPSVSCDSNMSSSLDVHNGVTRYIVMHRARNVKPVATPAFL